MDRRKLRRLLASSSFATLLIVGGTARAQNLTNPAGETTAFLRVDPGKAFDNVRNEGLITNKTGSPGIEVIGNGKVLGEIDNDGTIALSDTLTATGILVHGTSAVVGEGISNDGLIEVEASILARGIVVDGKSPVVSAGDAGAAILNEGTIDVLQRFVSATAIAFTTGATNFARIEIGKGDAVGIFVGSDATLNGIVANRGDLTVRGTNDVALAIAILATTGNGTVDGDVDVDERAVGVSMTGPLLPGFTNSGGIDVAVVNNGSLVLRLQANGSALVTSAVAIEGRATGAALTFDTLDGDVLLSEGGIDVGLSQSAKVTTTAIGDKAKIGTALITSTAVAVGLQLDGTLLGGGVENDGDITVDVIAKAAMVGKATGEGAATAIMVITTHDVTGIGMQIEVDTILGSFVNDGGVDVAVTGSAKVGAKAVSTGDVAVATADGLVSVEASGILVGGQILTGNFENEGDIGVHAEADLSAVAFASNVAGKTAFALADAVEGDVDALGLGVEFTSATGTLRNAGDVRATASYAATAKATAFGDTAAHAVANLSAGASARGVGFGIDNLIGSLSNDGNVVAIAKLGLHGSAYASASDGKATATARYLEERSVTAAGVEIFLETATGALANSGSVLAESSATVSLLAKAKAADTAVARVSNFFSFGSIEAAAEGVAIEADTASGLSNHGDITAHAIVTLKGSALAAGDKATAIADLISFPLDAVARGLEFTGLSGGTIQGSIANSGDVRAIAEMDVALKADATAETGPAFAQARLITPQFFAAAIDIDVSTVEGSIENSGNGVAIAGAEMLIAATATGKAAATATINVEAIEAGARGLDISADVLGPVHNSGSFLAIVGLTLDMRASAVGTAAKALAPNPHFIELTADGMHLEALALDGDITNSGELTGEAILSARATFGLEAYAKGSNAATATAIWRSMLIAEGRGLTINVATMAGNITNHGAVQGGALLGLRASATALMKSGGTAHADAGIFSGTAEATGFGIAGEILNGDISNDGEFILADAVGFLAVRAKASATVAGDASATAKVGSISVLANGIDINVAQLHGSVTNEGEVTAAARISATVSALAAGEGGKASAVFQADSLFANAYDVNGQTIDGDIRNSGALFAEISMNVHVKATMSGSGKAIAQVGSQPFRAEGMEVEFTRVGGSVTNSADITARALLAVTAAAQGGGLVQANIATQAAQAFGLSVKANVIDGGVSNSGRVLAVASAHGKADGDGGVSARIKATAQAMSVGSNDMNASVINDGTLLASAIAGASAFAGGGSGTAKAAARATGLVVDLGNFFGGVENNGLIQVKASAAATATAAFGQLQEAVATAIGVKAAATIQAAGGLINRGTILASAKADAPALAIGQVIVDTGVWAGALSNATDGQIRVFASDASKATAIGMAIRGGAQVQGGVVNAGTIVAEAVSGDAHAIAIDLSQATNQGNVVQMLDGALMAVTHTALSLTSAAGTAVLMDGNGQTDELDWSGGLILADIIGDSLDKIDVFAGVDNVFNFSELIDGVGEINLNTAAHAATPVEWRINGLVSQYNDFNVNENGTLVVGTRARIVGTSYNQDEDARVFFEIAPGNGNNGTIEPNLGNLDGTIGVRPLAGLYFDSQTHLVIIGNVTGSFDNTEINTPLLNFTVEQNSPDVVLTVTRNAFGSVPGLTHNEKELAGALDDLYDPNALGDSEIGGVVGELFTLNTDELLDAYDELAGAEFAQMAYAAFEQMEFVLGGVNQRLHDARSRSSGAGQSASLGNQSLQYAAINAGEGVQGTQMAAIGNDPDHPGSVWGKGYGSWGKLDGDDEAPGYDRTTGAIMVGLDYRFDQEFLVGIVGAYSFSNLDFDDGDNGDIDSFQIGLFGSWDSGTWYVDGLVSYAFQSYDTERHIDFGMIDEKAEADYDGGAVQVYGEVGYQFEMGEQALLTPLLGLGYTSVWTSDFTESGASGANLRVDNASFDSLATTLGVRGSLNLDGWEPSLFLGWRHEFLDDHGEADIAFAAVPDSKWQVIGSDVSSDAGLVGVGVVAEISAQFEAVIDYGGQFSGSGTNHTGSLGLRFKF